MHLNSRSFEGDKKLNNFVITDGRKLKNSFELLLESAALNDKVEEAKSNNSKKCCFVTKFLWISVNQDNQSGILFICAINEKLFL